MNLLNQLVHFFFTSNKKIEEYVVPKSKDGLFDNVGDFKTLAFETASFLIELTRNLEEKNIQIKVDFHLILSAHIRGPVTYKKYDHK